MQEKFQGNEKVVRVLSQYVICCSSGKETVDVTADNFDTFLKRFGPFNDCVDKAQKVFFFGGGEGKEPKLKQWYHGAIKDTKDLIKRNEGKYLVREPSDAKKWNLFTVEYSKRVKRSDGKVQLVRNKRHLQIDPKRGLFIWKDNKTSKKRGSPDVEVALKAITSKRDPIRSKMWESVENACLYVAADDDE